MAEKETKKRRFSSKKIVEILDLLAVEYPDAGCALDHRNVYELIVCVVLSAQTTDASVNRVSPELFAKYPTASELAMASQEDVMEIIRTIGMYKTKSKNIISLAKALCEKHGGKVPKDYDALVALPGVGRKTANVVLAVGFGEQRIAVDTHVFRVSHRIGLAVSGEGESAKAAGQAEVLATEMELMKILPKERWSEAHHSLIWHGRKCCTARNPKCENCVLNNICRNRQK
ncbi:MAG: endonuclease III [Bacillota bacterium]|nr:endonuclease III [Bacillota bacterium]